jgi:hypothetical protein
MVLPRYDVFLSYSHRDAAIVEQVARQLNAIGVTTWIDELEIVGGENIILRIQDGMTNSDYFAAFLSEHFNESLFAREELSAAMMELLSPLGRKIIPVRLDDDPVPTLLAARKYCDFRHSFLTGFDQLARALRIEPNAPRLLVLDEDVTLEFVGDGSVARWTYARIFEMGQPVGSLRELVIHSEVEPTEVSVDTGVARVVRETGFYAIYSDHPEPLTAYAPLRQTIHYELHGVHGDPEDFWFYSLPTSFQTSEILIRFPFARLPESVSVEFEREGMREAGPELLVRDTESHREYATRLQPHHNRYRYLYFTWRW